MKRFQRKVKRINDSSEDIGSGADGIGSGGGGVEATCSASHSTLAYGVDHAAGPECFDISGEGGDVAGESTALVFDLLADGSDGFSGLPPTCDTVSQTPGWVFVGPVKATCMALDCLAFEHAQAIDACCSKVQDLLAGLPQPPGR